MSWSFPRSRDDLSARDVAIYEEAAGDPFEMVRIVDRRRTHLKVLVTDDQIRERAPLALWAARHVCRLMEVAP